MLDKEEINRITHVCSISNHPVSKLPMEIRENYLQGLRAVLPMSSPFMDVLFRAWEISILGEGIALIYDSSNPKERVKTAIKLNRVEGELHGFRLAYPFFFDCFYLTSLCGNAGLIHERYERLAEYCNLITRKALQRVYEFFRDGIPCGKIPKELRNHRDANMKYASIPLKRILVVANVSAGKSTLINALIGKRLNKTATTTCTKDLCYIFNKPQEDGLTIKQRKTGEIIYVNDTNKCVSEKGESIGLHFVSDMLKDKKICLIDTPGLNNVRYPEHHIITERAIKSNDYDAVLYVANARYMGTSDEHCLMKTIVQSTKKPVVFVLNRLDEFEPSKETINETVMKYKDDIIKLGIEIPLIVPLSALMALLTKLKYQNLLDEEDEEVWYRGKKKFAKDYYNLPKYVHDGQVVQLDNLLDRSGMIMLETAISKI